MHLTDASVRALLPPDQGQSIFRQRGLAVRVTAGGCKSFVLEKLIDRRVRRFTLGRCDALTLRQAQALARKEIGTIALGDNPADERIARRSKTTGSGLVENIPGEFIARHVRELKAGAEVERILRREIVEPWRGRTLAVCTLSSTESAIGRRPSWPTGP